MKSIVVVFSGLVFGAGARRVGAEQQVAAFYTDTSTGGVYGKEMQTSTRRRSLLQMTSSGG